MTLGELLHCGSNLLLVKFRFTCWESAWSQTLISLLVCGIKTFCDICWCKFSFPLLLLQSRTPNLYICMHEVVPSLLLSLGSEEDGIIRVPLFSIDVIYASIVFGQVNILFLY